MCVLSQCVYRRFMFQSYVKKKKNYVTCNTDMTEHFGNSTLIGLRDNAYSEEEIESVEKPR